MTEAQKLLRQVPPVLRARDFRLYTQGGGRLVDLWQAGGAAVLGHTPPGVLREAKNAAERGLCSAFPHPMEGRFIKALARLFPNALFRVYAGEGVVHGLSAQIWRPFLQDADPFALPKGASLVKPVLPWALAPAVLVLAEPPESFGGIPPSDCVAPATLAGATRSVYDLIAAESTRGKADFPKIREALEDSPWRRSGIYLFYSEPFDDETYAGLFQRFLEGGFLLPPDRLLPAILPGILSPGEETKLARLLSSSPDG
ncbi:MAG: hypothetical protein LBG73_04090 [Spirochaetaceae bacterium]|jgi:hypothetical protein|nr:hypothetical protein [Spirochaetaceae bacterium]